MKTSEMKNLLRNEEYSDVDAMREHHADVDGACLELRLERSKVAENGEGRDVDDIDSELLELEEKQGELADLIESLESDENLAHHVLNQDTRDAWHTRLELAQKLIRDSDYSVFEGWDAYVDSYIEGCDLDLPAIILNNIDKEAIANELSMHEQWDEIGGMIYIFYG